MAVGGDQRWSFWSSSRHRLGFQWRVFTFC